MSAGERKSRALRAAVRAAVEDLRFARVRDAARELGIHVAADVGDDTYMVTVRLSVCSLARVEQLVARLDAEGV